MSQTDFELLSEIDQDGFIALLCPGAYAGYVDEHWTLKQVIARFLRQMNERNLFIAHPGPHLAGESLRIASRPSPKNAVRETSSCLRVGGSGLWLTDYAQLTMAAQFADEQPIAGHHTRLPVPAGFYLATLRQFAAPTPLELVIQDVEASEKQPALSAIPWLA